MSAIAILLLVSALIYAWFIFSIAVGWKKIKPFICENQMADGDKLFVSVIIAARNEENVIAQCLHDLCNQHYSSNAFEIIVVDDHSTDSTSFQVKKVMQQNSCVRLINLTGKEASAKGKKAAIASGIKEARGELIVTTDADCRFKEHWLKCITSYYKKHQVQLISAPVTFMPQNHWSGKFMELEFISLVTAGAGGLGLKKPLMCNGANLAFRRETFIKLNPFKESEKWASGDDMFLMHSIQKEFGAEAIRFLKSADAIVKTPSPKGIHDFIMQRLRWGSKTKAYANSFTATVAMVVFLNSLLLLAISFLLPFRPSLLFPVLTSWLLKISSDFFLLYQGCSFFKRKGLLIWLIPFQLIHVVYITFGALLASFMGYVWKGRKH